VHPRHLQGAPIEGGVLVDLRVGALVLGQDLRAGYIGQDGVHYQLYLTESIVLRIDEPLAICTISATLSSLRSGTTATPAPG
jgi:uncharacterized linocin/CFP29 family protein